jgi:hypothetical protein
MAAVDRVAITLSHRGIVRMALRKSAASPIAAAGPDSGDDARSDTEDAGWVGEMVMAEKKGGGR